MGMSKEKAFGGNSVVRAFCRDFRNVGISKCRVCQSGAAKDHEISG